MAVENFGWIHLSCLTSTIFYTVLAMDVYRIQLKLFSCSWMLEPIRVHPMKTETRHCRLYPGKSTTVLITMMAVPAQILVNAEALVNGEASANIWRKSHVTILRLAKTEPRTANC